MHVNCAYLLRIEEFYVKRSQKARPFVKKKVLLKKIFQ